MRLRAPALLLVALLAIPGAARADVVLDGSTLAGGQPLALEARPAFDGTPTYLIEEALGQRPGSGANLFHSFERLDVEAGHSALFRPQPGGTGGVRSVIARVTGDTPSRIDGRIESLFPGASLFLLNRHGLRFGASSELRLSGDFLASSAGALRIGDALLETGLADDSFAGADGDVSAFVFRDAAEPGALRLDGARLSLAPSGRSFGLIGGDVEVRGGWISTRAGDVALASVAGAGEVHLHPDPLEPAQRRISMVDVSHGGTISLLDDAIVSSSGIEPRDPSDPGSGDALIDRDGSGDIVVRGGRLVVLDADLRSFSRGGVPGGDIDVVVSGGVRIERRERATFTGLDSRRRASPRGAPDDVRAGDIEVRARRIELLGGGQISATTEDAAGGGEVRLHAGGVEIAGAAGPARSGVFSSAASSGDAGRIAIEAERLLLRERGVLIARSGPEDPDADPAAVSGRAGDIDVDVDALEMSGDARIDSSITGMGGGGDIRVDVSGDARLAGSTDDVEFTGITTLGHPTSSAEAGTIALAARRVLLADGARLSARSEGTGDAGSIEVTASEAIELDAARIETESVLTDGGNIDLRAPRRIGLVDAAVSASVRAGRGGNVTIDPEFLVLDRGRILARATTGAGGNIDITAAFLLASPDSLISATASSGVDGSVVVRSPSSDLSSGLPALAAGYLEADELLELRCGERDDGGAGRFVQIGPPAPPLDPDDPLRASYAGLLPPGTRAEALARVERLESLGALDRALAALDASPDAASAPGRALRARLRAGLGDVEGARADIAAALERAGSDRAPDLEARVWLDAAALRGETPGRVRAALERAAGLAPAGSALRVSIEVERAARAPDPAGARVHWSRAREALDGLEARASDAALLLRMARVGERVGAPAAGVVELHAHAARRADAAADAAGRAATWLSLAEVYERRARARDATELNLRALRAAQEARRRDLLQRAWQQRGRLLRSADALDEAAEALRTSAALLQAMRAQAALDRDAQRAFARAFPAEPLYTELAGVLLAQAARTEDPAERETLLAETRARVEELRAVELRDYLRDECVAREAALAAPPARSAVVYPLLLPDRTELLLWLPSGLRSVPGPRSGPEVLRDVRRLRRAAEDRASFGYWRPARRLYDDLVRPLDAHLAGMDLDVLIFAPTGALRGLPFAALHDERDGRFLIERVPVVVLPGAASAARASTPGELRVLRAGLTESVQGFPALPRVGEELESIGRVFDGDALLDRAFRRAALLERLAHDAYGVVHVASHGEFSGRVEDSFLLTWDGRLGIDDLSELARGRAADGGTLELLTLSACQTAAGDELSALGLAGAAVRAGARSTLASLWYVDDASTARLMAGFYRALGEPDTSRARALQRAQLELLRDPRHAHPAHWSAFQLIGGAW